MTTWFGKSLGILTCPESGNPDDIEDILESHVAQICNRKLVPVSDIKEKCPYEAVLNQLKTVPAGYTPLMFKYQMFWFVCKNYEMLIPKLHPLLINITETSFLTRCQRDE